MTSWWGGIRPPPWELGLSMTPSKQDKTRETANLRKTASDLKRIKIPENAPVYRSIIGKTKMIFSS